MEQLIMLFVLLLGSASSSHQQKCHDKAAIITEANKTATVKKEVPKCESVK